MITISSSDSIYKKAKKIVLSDNNCSISYLQRKLEIGYNRAGMIIEALQRDNVISSQDKNGIRKVIGK